MTDFGNVDRRDSNVGPQINRTARRSERAESGDDSDRVAALRAELESKEARIAELETELEYAREFGDLAENFVEALLDRLRTADVAGVRNDAGRRTSTRSEREGEHRSADSASDDASSGEETNDAFAAFGAMMDEDETDEPNSNGTSDTVDGLAALAGIGDGPAPTGNGEESPGATDRTDPTPAADGGGLTVRSISTEVAEFQDGIDALSRANEDSFRPTDGRPGVVVEVEEALSTLNDVGRAMLARYRAHGPQQPESVYEAVTDGSDRVAAYERNRSLRRAGLVEHVGRGHYEYSLRSRLAAEIPADRGKRAGVYARDLEQQYLD